jgi:hypothetical protein
MPADEPSGAVVSTRSVKTACERDDCRFMAVEPVVRAAAAARTQRSASRAEPISNVLAPSIAIMPPRPSRSIISEPPSSRPPPIDARRLPPSDGRPDAGGEKSRVDGEGGSRTAAATSSTALRASRSRSLSQ